MEKKILEILRSDPRLRDLLNIKLHFSIQLGNTNSHSQEIEVYEEDWEEDLVDEEEWEEIEGEINEAKIDLLPNHTGLLQNPLILQILKNHITASPIFQQKSEEEKQAILRYLNSLDENKNGNTKE